MEEKKSAAFISNQKTSTENTEQVLNSMIPITNHLIDLFTNAILQAYPQINGDATIAIITPVSPNASKFGDYQCNSAMPISKALKTSGISKPPKDIAHDIKACLKNSPIITKTEVAASGFINIFIEK